MTIETAQSLSAISLGFFAYDLLCVVLAFFFDVGRRAIAWVVVTGLLSALILALISGRLYYWHHFERFVP